jgi:hypothetical protein
MKKEILSILVMTSSLISFAQTDINLNLDHQFDGQPFAYGTVYTDGNGNAVQFTRVQYYLSGFSLTHDGGTVTDLPDAYVLGSGNISDYSLGTASVSTIEEISFDLGLDYSANHLGTSNWTSPHPLSAQSPSMDWSWPSGYFFFTIEGEVDDNADGTPNKVFEMHGIGDILLTDISAFTGISVSGSTITLPFQVNVADWIKNVDLAAVGYDHSGSIGNRFIADNTNVETVFTFNAAVVSTEELEVKENNIYANYELPYAPTIFYSLGTNEKVDIKIYSISGAVVMESSDQNPEGNYFIRKELESGTYIITFSNGMIEESCKFIVQK